MTPGVASLVPRGIHRPNGEDEGVEAVIAGIAGRVLELIEPLYATAGYAVIAVGVLAERSIFLGLIVPGDVILVLGGVYAAQGELSIVAVIALGTVAGCLGESIGYGLGRRYGRTLIARLPFVNRVEHRFDDAERYFERHGGKTVAIGRYATAAGAFVPFVAGLARMRYRRFLVFDVPAILVWAAAISLFGFAFGKNVDLVDRALSRFGYVMLAILVAFLGGRWAIIRLRGRRDAGEQDPGSPSRPS